MANNGLGIPTPLGVAGVYTQTYDFSQRLSPESSLNVGTLLFTSKGDVGILHDITSSPALTAILGLPPKDATQDRLVVDKVFDYKVGGLGANVKIARVIGKDSKGTVAGIEDTNEDFSIGDTTIFNKKQASQADISAFTLSVVIDAGQAPLIIDAVDMANRINAMAPTPITVDMLKAEFTEYASLDGTEFDVFAGLDVNSVYILSDTAGDTQAGLEVKSSFFDANMLPIPIVLASSITSLETSSVRTGQVDTEFIANALQLDIQYINWLLDINSLYSVQQSVGTVTDTRLDIYLADGVTEI